MEKIRQDGFSIDGSTQQVMFDTKPLVLKPKTTALFILLYQHKGHVVQRQEIISSIWQNDPGVEDALAKSVSEIRKVLKDCGQEELLTLETIYKVGYRFANAGTTSIPIRPQKPKRSIKSTVLRVLFWVLITVVTVILTMMVFFGVKG